MSRLRTAALHGKDALRTFLDEDDDEHQHGNLGQHRARPALQELVQNAQAQRGIHGTRQLAGTVYAALGLGVLNKFLEGWAGAVLAKIAVLVFIIIFIQKRPQGIFAMKGRSAEA